MRPLARLGDDVARRHGDVAAGVPGERLLGEAAQRDAQSLLPHGALVRRVDQKTAQLGLRRRFAGAEVDAAVREQIEGRETLGHPGRMVEGRRHLDDAVAEANALGALRDRGQEHLRRARVAVLLEEVVLDLPHVVDPEPVGERALLERLLQHAVLGVGVPGARQLVLVEDTELHAHRTPRPFPRHAPLVYTLAYTGMARTTRAPSRARRRLLPRTERRQVILRAAAAAFARTGYAATSMEDIAAAAGITRLIVYRHFASKEALYRAVLQGAFGRFAAALEGAPEPGGYGVGARALLAVARADEDGFRLLWRHACREARFARYADALRRQAVAAARVALADRVPRGEPRVGRPRRRGLPGRGRPQLARVRRSQSRRAVRRRNEPCPAGGRARLGRFREREGTPAPPGRDRVNDRA